MGGTIHCKMTRVGGVSLGHDRMDPEGSMQVAGMGGGVGRPGLYHREGCEGGAGMYQVEKLGEMVSYTALG